MDSPETSPATTAPDVGAAGFLQWRIWLTPSVLAAAGISVASGFAQFSITAIIGDVAAAFGEQGPGDDIASQIGLTATTLGIALGVIRLASLGSLPGAALADRFGRRRVLLITLTVGLLFTASAAGAPTFWVFVVAVALARPWLSTVNAIAGVVAAEDVSTAGRSWAIGFVGGAYGFGAGIVAVMRGVLGNPSFRLIALLSLVPLLLMPAIAKLLHEPEIFEESDHAEDVVRHWWPGAVPSQYRTRLLLYAAITFGIALGTGPGFTYLFVYGEQVLGGTPGQLSLLVFSAGPVGFAGLLLGRWASDVLGRRWASAISLAATALTLVVMYRGSLPLFAAGYLLSLLASSAFGPPAGALLAEIFPTAVRATASGWAAAAGVFGAVTGLAGFGVLADRLGSFESAVMVLTVPILLTTVLFLFLPETRGLELDAPEALA